MNNYLFITIIDKNNDKDIMGLLNKNKVPFDLITYASGTKNNHKSQYLEKEQIKNKVIFSLVNQSIKENLLYELHHNIQIYKKNKGIAFCIPLVSSGKFLYDGLNNINIKGDDYKMIDKNKYELILAIVNEGYADEGYNAALKSGARGGTLIHGRGMGTIDATKLLGITLQAEKDLILILSPKEDRLNIMNAITESIGLTTKGNGICFSLPVESVVGLSEKIDFFEK